MLPMAALKAASGGGPGKVGPVPLVLGAAGVGLVVAAIMNVSPGAAIRRAVGATDDPPPPIYDAPAATVVPAVGGSSSTAGEPVASAVFGPAGMATGRGSLTPGSGLVTSQRAKLILDRKLAPSFVNVPGHPGRKLDYEASQSFVLVERAYGKKLHTSGTWRSEDDQAAGNASDPGRFAPAGKGAHPVGLAVDLDTGKVNVEDPALVEAFLARGWFRVGRSGHMHWSYGVPA